MMKPYFLVMGTLLIVGVGCTVDKMDFAGDSIVDKGVYTGAPPAMMAAPGPMVAGPGPGVMPMMGPPPVRPFATTSTQIRFYGPSGMVVGWQIGGGWAENQLVAPAKYNFQQGFSYQLKFSNIPGEGREGLILYPTLAVYPAHPHTDAYLAHNSVPLQLTDEDIDQVRTNNFVTKVVYLPDPKNQELAIANVEILVSTRLEPGMDPVAEADRRGTIMAVLRVGNKDLETTEQPAAPVSGGPRGGHEQVAYQVNGEEGQYLPPAPIGGIGIRGGGIPGPMMMGMPGQPGQPPVHPISGVGPTPAWGMTMTGTPIGLPGPPHMPYGAPAGLKSHTVRNLSKNKIPKPVDHVLIDVKHNPGINIPPPVKHIQYTENHPQFKRGVVTEGFGGGAAGGEYCPPGQEGYEGYEE